MDMKKNILLIIVGLILIALFFLIVTKTRAEDKPYNQIELSANNNIHNEAFPSYYDTALSVAMDEMGLVGYNVVVEALSNEARSQFDGELKAHVRYYNGAFYLFTEMFNRNQIIDILSHEVIHMQQYASGDLIYNNDVIWKGETIPLNSKEYEERPWEADAFSRQSGLISLVEKKLYNID